VLFEQGAAEHDGEREIAAKWDILRNVAGEIP
jgi:hypothetical protein